MWFKFGIDLFLAFFKCKQVNKLTQCHKPWMDIAINGNDFQQKDMDFGDVFYQTRFKETTFFGKMFLIL